MSPTPTLRESIASAVKPLYIVLPMAIVDKHAARLERNLESLLSDRIREARVEEIDALYARADHDLVLRDKLDDLYKLRYANMGGSNVFTLDRLAALQEKRNDT